jgi:Bacterial Ig domain
MHRFPWSPSRRPAAVTRLASIAVLLLALALPPLAAAGKAVTKRSRDTTPPTLSIASPVAGAVLSGNTVVSGSASDNVQVAKVEVSVDGGAYASAQGTTSWSYALDTTTLANGSHTITARATDTSGNTATASETVDVENALPPGVVQQLVTPEGATIDIYADAVGWTAQQIYDVLKPNAYQLSLIGPMLTIDVTAQYASQTSTSASSSNGVWGNYQATITLQANGTSAFATRPDAVVAHEYGHAWTNYYYYVKWQRDWTPYLVERGIYGNPLVDSSYQWSTREMIADDYRLLFGTSAAQSEMAYINPDVPDPRTVSGLKDWFVNTWAG